MTSVKRLLSLISIPCAPVLVLFPLWGLKRKARRYKGFEIAYRLRQKIGGYYIGAGAECASKPLFPHGYGGIYISGGARIGKDCVIFQQVTIGSDSLLRSSKWGSPTIGDRCYIGAGAKIIGSVTVGDDCRIGANAVVYNDVPPNSTVVAGGGMRIIHHDAPPDNRFVNWGANGWQYWGGRSFRPLDRAEWPHKAGMKNSWK